MIRSVLLALGFAFCLPYLASAQVTDDFTIRVFGALDNEAPSTTTIQSITPITSSQIDLSWATSTDNFNVFGYVVSRDGVPIATTTSLFYSDTGLMASTTYSYTVQAFDGVPNYSSSSVPAATTTLDIPVVVPPTSATSTTGGTAARVVLESFSVTPDIASASMFVGVRRPARIEIRIGETSSYEIGYISGTVFAREHNIPLSDLHPDTTYYYEVYGYTPSGAQTFLRSGSFATLGGAQASSPANVALFTAEADGSDVYLEWRLPNVMPEGGKVRIVRSHYDYPTFVNDGVVVYEGEGEQVRDQDVLNLYDRIYYTAFVIDPSGRTSSGAIAQIMVRSDGLTAIGPGSQPLDNQGTQEGVSTTTPNEIISLDMPDSSAITVTQLGDLFTMASNTISLSSDAVFTVSVPVDVIEGDFKTIVATLDDPRGSQKTFSFLLRLNSERTMYEATIAAVQFAGVSDFMVEIYDYDSLVVARYTTSITFTPNETVASSTLEVLWYRFVSFAWFMAIIIPFLVLLWLWFVYKRREEEEVVV